MIVDFFCWTVMVHLLLRKTRQFNEEMIGEEIKLCIASQIRDHVTVMIEVEV